jgi:hypothetical protein
MFFYCKYKFISPKGHTSFQVSLVVVVQMMVVWKKNAAGILQALNSLDLLGQHYLTLLPKSITGHCPTPRGHISLTSPLGCFGILSSHLLRKISTSTVETAYQPEFPQKSYITNIFLHQITSAFTWTKFSNSEDGSSNVPLKQQNQAN